MIRNRPGTERARLDATTTPRKARQLLNYFATRIGSHHIGTYCQLPTAAKDQTTAMQHEEPKDELRGR